MTNTNDEAHKRTQRFDASGCILILPLAVLILAWLVGCTSHSTPIGLELARLGSSNAADAGAAASDANGADADADGIAAVRVWNESPSVSRATAAEHASACPVAAAPASHTNSTALCDCPLQAAASAPASPSNVAAAAHASSVRIWLGGHNEESAPPLPPHPPPAPNLLNLPADCAFSILLLLDGTSLASLSATCTALLDLTRGADAAFLWRGVARADVARLRLHERLGFAEPLWPVSTADEGEAQWEDEWDENGSHAPAPAGASSGPSTARPALSPRVQYLLRLKQRAHARASRAAETARQRSLVRGVRARDALFVRRQVCLESTFMVLLPGALLASSLLLQASDAYSGADADSSSNAFSWAVCVWLPIWIALAGAVGLGVAMQRLRREFSCRKRREMEDARGAPPIVLVVPPATITATAAAAGTNAAAPPAAGAAAAPGSNAAASFGSAAAAAAAAATAARTRSDAALERERLNTRFLSTRRAAGFSASTPGDPASPSAATDGGSEGLLAALMDHYFSFSSHVRLNLLRLGAVLASAAMLCAKTGGALDRDRLSFAACFAPFFLLGLHALLLPLLPARWCAPSFASSSSTSASAWVRSRTGAGAGAGAGARIGAGLRCRAVLAHLASFLAWWACPLLFLALLAAHLDSGAPRQHEQQRVSLVHAMLPLWVWQGCLAAALTALVLRFGAGIVLLRRRWSESQQQAQQHSFAAAGQPGTRFFSLLRHCCPFSSGVFVVRDPSHRNGRMACTVAAVLAALVGLAVFEALLCERSAQLQPRSDLDPDPDPRPRPTSTPLHSAWVCLPLSLSLLVCLVLAVVSATQMRRQRLAAFSPSPSAPAPASALADSGAVSSAPLFPSVRGQGARGGGGGDGVLLAASPTVTSASALGGRRALSA